MKTIEELLAFMDERHIFWSNKRTEAFRNQCLKNNESANMDRANTAMLELLTIKNFILERHQQ